MNVCRCYFHCILADDTSEVNSFTTSFDCQPDIVIIIYYSFPHTVDSEEESYNGTESKSVREFSELESDVEKEGLHEPPNTPSNFECESEIDPAVILMSMRTRLKMIQMHLRTTLKLHLNAQCSMQIILNHCILVQIWSILLYYVVCT